MTQTHFKQKATKAEQGSSFSTVTDKIQPNITMPTFPSDSALKEQYALSDSRFETLAGEPVHFVDEGQGPAILLLHGSYASLRQWDAWACKLKNQYRVVRYDKSPAGLSGPNPEGDYTTQQQINVIDALMDKLDIERFVIVATSSAGVTAAAYAAEKPERINGLILGNIAAGPVNMDYASFPQSLIEVLETDQQHPDWHSKDYWREILLVNVENKSNVTPELVEQWTYLNHRMMRAPAITKQVADGTDMNRTPDDLKQITVPTLLLWSENDHETSLEEHGMAAFGYLKSPDKELLVVQDCGHMILLDRPDESLDNALPFIQRVCNGGA